MQFRYPLDTINIKTLFNINTHRGIDFGWFSDTPDEPIYAVCDGVVVEVRNDCKSTTPGSGTYGNYIKIKHDNNVYSLYAHCKYNCSEVKVGDNVKAHQRINTLGNTGDSYGPHCHFEIFEGNNKVDPLKYLRVYPGQNIFYNSIKKDLQNYIEEKPIKLNFKKGDKVIVNGYLHEKACEGSTRGIYLTNYIDNISLTCDKYGTIYPYNIGSNYLGWVRESDIKIYEEPKKEVIIEDTKNEQNSEDTEIKQETPQISTKDENNTNSQEDTKTLENGINKEEIEHNTNNEMKENEYRLNIIIELLKKIWQFIIGIFKKD